MSKLKSDIGALIDDIRAARAASSGVETKVVDGWKKSPHTFYLDDVAEAYKRMTGWIRNEEQFVLFAIGSRAAGFRRSYTFTQEGSTYCALLFSRWYGSFLFVFGIDESRAVELYHMGVSYASPEKETEDVTAYCSRISTDFAAVIETEYFDLRDKFVGRFGIQGAVA